LGKVEREGELDHHLLVEDLVVGDDVE